MSSAAAGLESPMRSRTRQPHAMTFIEHLYNNTVSHRIVRGVMSQLEHDRAR
jgi:hypothetical protein